MGGLGGLGSLGWGLGFKGAEEPECPGNLGEPNIRRARGTPSFLPTVYIRFRQGRERGVVRAAIFLKCRIEVGA